MPESFHCLVQLSMGASKQTNGLVYCFRKTHSYIGFKKGYNFVLCKHLMGIDLGSARLHHRRVHLRRCSTGIRPCPLAVPFHRRQISSRCIPRRMVLATPWFSKGRHHASSRYDTSRRYPGDLPGMLSQNSCLQDPSAPDLSRYSLFQ